MAHIYKRPDSPNYYADYLDRDGNRQQKSTHRRRARDAQLVADELERRALRDPVALARDTATLRTAFDLLSKHLAASVDGGTMADDTAQHYVAKAKQLKRVFGEARLLSTIDTAAVRDYCAARRLPYEIRSRSGKPRTIKPASNHTLVKEINALRLALRLAKERKLWAGDLDTLQPADLSSDYKPRERVLALDEVPKLRAELEHARWRVVAFALGSGAELKAFKRAMRPDVDLDAGFVHVRGTKHKTRDRDVPVVLPICRELLSEALQGADYAGTKEHPIDPPLLFKPWPNVRRGLIDACARAGIPPVTPNDLRRSFATWHIEAGVSLDVLFRPMGHVDTVMLSRVYGKPSREVMAEQMREAVARRKKGEPEK